MKKVYNSPSVNVHILKLNPVMVSTSGDSGDADNSHQSKTKSAFFVTLSDVFNDEDEE